MTPRPSSRWWTLAAVLVLALLIWTGLAATAARGPLAALAGRRPLKVLIHDGVEGVAMKKVIADYARLGRVAVEVLELPYDQLYQAALGETRVGRDADVLMLDDPWLPALATSGALREVRLDARQCQQWQPHDFPEPVLRVASGPRGSGTAADPGQCSPYGPLYALPFVGNSQLFCASGATAPHDTWSRVMAPGPGSAASRYVMRVGPGNPIVTDFMPVLWALSPSSLASEPLRLEPDALAAVELVAAFGRPDNAALTILSYDDFDLAVYLARREASMTIMWSAWAMAMATLPPDVRSRFAGCGALPGTGRVAGDASAPALGAWLLGLSARATAARSQEALRFVLFATSPEELVVAARAGNPPPRTSVLRDPKLAEQFPTFPAQLASLTAARARPRTPHWRSVERTLGVCLSAVYEGAITAPDALSRINYALALLPAAPPPDDTCRYRAGAGADLRSR